jgi:precorrin-2 dehydrogenase/sirohydrochlorin ferrochelatase
MSYFPAFIRFDNKRIIIIGGGNIAFEKLEHLLDFTNNITLISLDFNENTKDLINKNSLSYFQKAYEEGDIKDFDIVIAAIDNFDLQEQIYFETRKFNCLCNCVDLKKYCDFIFPAYIKKGDLTIAISTSGSSPAVAKQLKIWLNDLIPNSINDFLLEMKEYRKTMPKGMERMKFLEKKAKDYISTWKEEK